jgi:Tol biopolymer transport system component
MPAPFLTSGTSFGPYVVGERIGAGGMGEVYQARDTRLGRDVAMKVLPEAFAFDNERRSRLQREARVLASLNHPHIAAIHGLEEAYGHLALVLELVEGPTLADRLDRGPIPHAEAIAIAAEIGAALDAAHERGIIHRDLKPANIKLAPGRGVKVLDFGLAKAFSGSDPGSDPAQMPTVTSDGTRAGVILGTAAYMSPEQARGHPVDKRTDIWAFGCVVYEMLTGRLAFPGGTISDTIVSILDREPDWQALPEATPPRVRRLLRRCLEKDPGRRLRDIGDANIELGSMPGEDERATPVEPIRPSMKPWILAVGALALMALTAAATSLAVRRPDAPVSTPGGVVRFSIPPPPGNRFGGNLPDVETNYLALSPDGTQLAFVATDQKGTSRVWLRPLAALAAAPVAGTEGTISVFWSPDGRSLGFFAGDQLKRLNLPDGRPVSLTQVPAGAGLAGAWAPSGRILIGSLQGREISEISTAGGTSTTAATAEADEFRLYWPSFLPGDRFMYLAFQAGGTGALKLAEQGRAPRLLMPVNSNAAWVDPGYLLFAREGSLLAQRFDLLQGRPVGETHAITDMLSYTYMPPRALFSASPSGTVVYQSHRDTTRLVLIDRTGQEVSTIGNQPWYYALRASSDGKQVLTAAVDSRIGTNDLWVVDLARGRETRLTSDPLPEVPGPWGPGQRSIVFSVARGGAPRLFQRDLVTGAERQLLPHSSFQMAGDFTADGKQLVFTERGDRGVWALMTTTLDAKPVVAPLQSSPFSQLEPRLSRDGQAIAFVANDSGRSEIYVAAFPPTAAKILISTGGGRAPRWSLDGRELFYLSGDGRLMVVPIRTTPALDVGTPRALFSVPRPWFDFDVTSDAGRFIAIVPQVLARDQPVTVVLNWHEEIRK